MNARTNLRDASNSCNGGTMGRDSPSASLDMLAEVASQTLHSEKKHINLLLASQCKSKSAIMKRRESCFTVPQLLSMPVSHLVKQFAIFTSDELKRQYSYTCSLMPGCQQKYSSFASEGKARTLIKNHLEKHLQYFRTNKEAYDTFTATSVNYKNLKTNLQNKKSRMQQTKKPHEMLNKENKDVITEKSTNYLRKILSNDICIKEIEKQKCFQKSESKEAHNSELRNSEQVDFKVLGDHSYFERLDDKLPNRREMSSLNNVVDSAVEEKNIVLMVVGTDSVHMEEYSHVNQNLLSNDTNNPDSDPPYLSKISWSEESRTTTNRNTEASATTKPKGKAKFIGTSKEEREMALAYMDRIKKKGNPTGNNLQCRICDPPRTFTAPTTLVSHYRSHAGIKPYECRICRAVFTRRHSLKYHTLIHQNQTRFTCADCGKKFRHPSHFREHQRRHTGEAPFGCNDCGQRFKTRNTYKRHLKTRHGKILTTTGELLNLSEEDFQKVRTNRRRKNCAPEIAANADNITSNAIVDCGDQSDDAQIVEEYVLRENIDDVGRNWEAKSTIQVVDKCFESFEVCSESHLNKTDGIETEIAIDCRYLDRDDNSVKMECINGVQNDLLQLKNPFYTNLENQSSRIEVDCSNMIQSYTEVNSKNNRQENIDVVGNKVNMNFSEEQEDGSNLQMLQEQANNYHEIIYNNNMEGKSAMYVHLETKQTQLALNSNGNNQTNGEKYDMHVIIEQNNLANEGFNECANTFNDKILSTIKKEYADNNVTYCTQMANEDVGILQAFSEVGEEIIVQNQDVTLQQDEYTDEYKYVATDSMENLNVFSQDRTEIDQKIDQQQNKQYLYVRTVPLNGIIAPNKCINIPLRQINLYRDQQNQSKIQDNCRKIKVLNKDMQTIDIKQSDKQPNTILLVSDSLKNGILQIDSNNIAVKSVKR